MPYFKVMVSKELTRTPAVEDYAKAIFSLESRSTEPVSTNALAERLGITPDEMDARKRLMDADAFSNIKGRCLRWREAPALLDGYVAIDAQQGST